MVWKKGFYVLVMVFVVLFSVNFVFASFSAGDESHAINKIYGPEFPIKGWINISLSDEPSSSLFEDSFNNNITLKEALEKNPSYDYDCTPYINGVCADGYSTSGTGETAPFLDFGPERSFLKGFELSGMITSVNSISFNVFPENPDSTCSPPFKVDVLDDGEYEYVDNSIYASNELCGERKSYGCFDSEDTFQNVNLNSGNVYCEKINLSEAPGFRLGAWVKENSNGISPNMTLYSEGGIKKVSCSLPDISSEGEYSCDVEYPTSGGDHYICISNSGSGSYNVRGSAENACGFPGIPIKAETASYQIFATPRKFEGDVRDAILNDAQPNGKPDVSEKVQDYLIDAYGEGGEIDCSEGCVIPIKIYSEVNQRVVLDNLEVSYSGSIGDATEDKFYSIQKAPSKISSNFQKLYLDNFNFLTEDNTGEKNYILELDGEKVFEEEIEIKDAPIIHSLTPLRTATTIPTQFELDVESESDIKNYNWDFGDNSSNSKTTINKTTHTYGSTGNYTLVVQVTDVKNITSEKNFEIKVALPTAFINSKISELNSSIISIRDSISNLTTFQKQGVEDVLDLDFVESEVKRLNKAYDDAENESEYAAVVLDLLPLNLPEKVIKTSESNNFLFLPKSGNIDLNALQEIGGGDYSDNEDGYKNAVISWQQNNLIVHIDFEGFSQEKEGTATPLIEFFNFGLSEKDSIDYPYYFVSKSSGTSKISGASNSAEGYSYKDISNTKQISFYTTENLDPLNAPSFISPSLNRLEVNQNLVETSPDENPSRTLWVVAAIAILVIISLFIYMIMKEWYKRKYESTLFKDRNDLYNMVNYVNNAKKKGLEESEIRANLKKAGWSNERVRYVMRKYGGRNTGLFDPVEKIMRLFEKK